MEVDRTQYVKQRIVLEFSTFLYFIAKNAAIPIVQQYVYSLVAQKHNISLVDGEGDENPCKSIDSDLDIRHKVSEESSLLITYLNIAELLPSACIVLFLGRWSDVTGKRKILMWLPCLGNAIYVLGFLIPAYIWDGELNDSSMAIMFVCTILCGFSGNIPGFLSGNGAFISDTDSRERRTLRLAIVEFTIGMTYAFSNLALGFWVHNAGFLPSLWFVFAASLAGMIMIVVFLHEPSGDLDELGGQRAMKWEDFKSVKDVCGFRTLAQKKLWCIFIAFQMYVFVQQGQERTFVLFLQNAPLCWNAIKIGLFLFVLMFLSGLACWPGLPLLHRCGVSDVSIAIISVLSKAAGSISLAFAIGDVTVFTACALQLFHLAPYAVARSLVSKQVGVEDQGAIYGITHSVQALVSFLGPVLHNVVYATTIYFMKGTVFLGSGVLLGIPLGLLIGFRYLDKKEDEYWTIGGKGESDLHTPLSETSRLSDSNLDVR